MIQKLMPFFNTLRQSLINKNIRENYDKILLGQEKLPNLFIDLQWFAAEDEGRTEDPTEYKISEARKKGRVAKSGDLKKKVYTTLIKIPVLSFFFQRLCYSF